MAQARGLDEGVVRSLVDSLTQRPWLGLFGTEKVRMCSRLNIALEKLQPNVTLEHKMNQEATFEQCFPLVAAYAAGRCRRPSRTAEEFPLRGTDVVGYAALPAESGRLRMENETENDKWIFESYESK